MSKQFSIRNANDIEALEQAIKDEEARLSPPDESKPEDEPANSPQEEMWKKRYSDHRSFTAKKENEWKAREADLLKQIAAATQKEISFPKSEEEVSEWAQKYPDVYELIVTIAKKNAIEVTKGLDERVKAQDERDLQYARQVAYDALITAHEDFPDLRETEDFVQWLEAQPTYIYNALYENETDAKAAIRAIDLYKADRGISASKKKPDTSNKENATNPVQGRGNAITPGNGSELKYTESKVANMPWREQERNIAEIEKCMENPAFYDLSGGAR